MKFTSWPESYTPVSIATGNRPPDRSARLKKQRLRVINPVCVGVSWLTTCVRHSVVSVGIHGPITARHHILNYRKSGQCKWFR